MDLLGLRKQIDEIDNELIPLLLKRMSVSEQVAQYKAERGMPVLNSEREAACDVQSYGRPHMMASPCLMARLIIDWRGTTR